MPREENKLTGETYAERIALRIKELRTRKKLTREQLREALADNGCEVSLATVYAWENGNKGIEPNKYPALAKAFGFTTVRAFLPEV